MTIEEEHRALLRAGLLPEGADIESMLWGVISGGRLEGREGILFLADTLWGFYGRDFVYLTMYAGFVGALSGLSRCEGPLATGDTMESYVLEGVIEGEGASEQRYFFTPNGEMYRRRPEEIVAFFGALRQRVNNQIHPNAMGLFRQSLAHWEAGHLRDAEELLAAAGRIDTRSAVPAFFLGQLLLEQGDRSREALQQLRIAQERLFEDQPALCLALAQAHQQAGDLRSAEREARASLQHQESAEAHLLLAEIAGEQSRLRERAQHLKQAATLDPHGASMPWLAYDATQEKNWGHARQYLVKLSKEQQKHPAALVAEAYLAYHDGRQEEAVAFVKQALLSAPEDPVALLALQRWEIPSEPTAAISVPLQKDQANEQPHIAAEMFMWLHEQEQRLSREDVPLMLRELSTQIEIFSEQWGGYLMTCLLRGEPLEQAMEALQSRLREGMTEQARGFLQRARGWLREQWAAFVAHEDDLPLRAHLELPYLPEEPIAMTGKLTQDQLLLRLFEHAEIRLEALFSQLLQYTLGLLEGGLVTLFLLDLQSLDEQPDAERLASLLRERLRPIVQRLGIYLKAWTHQHIDLLEAAIGRLLDIPIQSHEEAPRFAEPLRPLHAPPVLAETSALEIPIHRGETTALPLIAVQDSLSPHTDHADLSPPIYVAERIDASLPETLPQTPLSPLPTNASPSRTASKSSISVSSAPGGGLFFLPKLPGEDQRAEAIPSTHRSSSPKSAPASSPSLSLPSKNNPLSGAAKAYRVSALSPSGSAPLFQSSASNPSNSGSSSSSGASSSSVASSSSGAPSLTERVLASALQPDGSASPSQSPEPSAFLPSFSLPSLHNDETTALDTAKLRPQIAGEETPATAFPAVPADEILPDPQDDPIGWAYAMYRRAFQSLGHAEPPTTKDRFVRILETKVHAWKQRTGQDPDIYVEIEQGRPQIKLRERETPRSRT